MKNIILLLILLAFAASCKEDVIVKDAYFIKSSSNSEVELANTDRQLIEELLNNSNKRSFQLLKGKNYHIQIELSNGEEKEVELNSINPSYRILPDNEFFQIEDDSKGIWKNLIQILESLDD